MRRRTCSDALSKILELDGKLEATEQYLLRIDGALQGGKVGRRLDGSEEDGLVLVHAGICEQQSRIRERDDRRRGHWEKSATIFQRHETQRRTEGVAIFLEELNEGLSDTVCAPLHFDGTEGG